MSEFLRDEIDRENENSFINRLYEDCYFDGAKFEKIAQICLNSKISDKQIKAGILDIFLMSTFLMSCHRDPNDVYKIKNFDAIDEKFRGTYFFLMRDISDKFLKD